MWQLIGQDKLLTLLNYCIKADAIAHAYLLVGPRHMGKMTLALNLAQALNCDAPEPPCGQCNSCQRILEGKHSDVISTGLESKTEIGIDEIRELQRLANLPPYEGKYKVFIIDGAEHLSTEAANSLLKILEEPPHKLIWLLLVADESRLLPTVISRCQHLELQPIPSKQIQALLINFYNVDSNKANLLTHLCRGSLGWVLAALADEGILDQRSQRISELSSLLTASLGQRFTYAQELANQFSQKRASIVETLEGWLSWWRDLMLVKGGCKEAITNIDYELILEKQAEGLSLSEIKTFLANLCLLQKEFSKNVNHRLALESLMLKLPGNAGDFSKAQVID